MNRVNPKAVALGFLLVLALDTVIGIGLLVLHSSEIFVEGRSAEQASQALHAVTGSTGFLLASMTLGTVTTAVGGYVAARIAKRFPYFNGLALGIVGALFGLAFWSGNPLWFNLLALATVIPTALLGASIAARRRAARA